MLSPSGAMAGSPLADLLRALPVTRAEAVEEEETATILYTSGTTGRPKGAMLTHFSIAHSVIHYGLAMGLTEEDRALLAVPMSHVTGLIALVDAMVHCAGTLVIMPAFKATEFIDLAARHRITYSLIVPAMFNLCLLAPNFDDADLSAWRVSGYGGAIMPEATLERIAERLPNLKLLNCYGSTETTSPAAIMPPEETVARKESVGLTVPCGHILVMDADGRWRFPAAQPGEIYIGGADGRAGLLQQPATRPSASSGPDTGSPAISGSWTRSGYLRIVDRIKDVINRGGLQDLRLRGRERPARPSRPSSRSRSSRSHVRCSASAFTPSSCSAMQSTTQSFTATAPNCSPTTRFPKRSTASKARFRATPTARSSSGTCAEFSSLDSSARVGRRSTVGMAFGRSSSSRIP